MVTTPNGYASWTRANDLTDIDGHENKHNRAGFGGTDVETDLSAEGQSRLQQIVIAAQNVMPLTVLTMKLNDTGAQEPTILSHLGQYGTGVAQAPSCTRVSDGVVEIVWDAAYTDFFGVSGAVDITAVQVTMHTESSSHVCTYKIIDPLTIRVYAEYSSTITVTAWNGGN